LRALFTPACAEQQRRTRRFVPRNRQDTTAAVFLTNIAANSLIALIKVVSVVGPLAD
jgi:hypothetical protein